MWRVPNGIDNASYYKVDTVTKLVFASNMQSGASISTLGRITFNVHFISGNRLAEIGQIVAHQSYAATFNLGF